MCLPMLTHKCRMQIKPVVDVQAAENMRIDEMVLVPMTTQDKMKFIDESDAPHHAFVATVTDGTMKRHFVLGQPDTKVDIEKIFGEST